MTTPDRHGGHGPHPVELIAQADWAPASSTPDRADGHELISDVMVPMRDGVRLGTDIYLPRGLTPVPAVMIRLPYGKTEDYAGMAVTAAWFARKGYACVVQDVRGKFSSEGEFEPLVNEIDDTYDAIGWVASQEWSDGRVGMWGESYYGWTSYCGAVGGHAALRAIAPGDIALDRYSHAYRGGAFAFNTVGNWAIAMTDQGWVDASVVDPWHLPLIEIAEAAGLDVPYLREVLSHPATRRVLEVRSMRELAVDKVRVPTLVWGGWYDVFSGPVRGRVADHQRAEACRPVTPICSSARGITTARATPPTGSASSRRRDGLEALGHLPGVLRPLPDGASQRLRRRRPGRDLYHRREPLAHPGGVAAERCGADTLLPALRRGRRDPRWGRRPVEIPPAGEPADTYDYDPQDPVADTLAMNCWAICNDMGDRGPVEDRADVLLYTTPCWSSPSRSRAASRPR